MPTSSLKTETTPDQFVLLKDREGLQNAFNVSASALKGNAALVCSLIELLTTTVGFLSKEAEQFLPVILYPLCQKASSQNHSEVQRTASFSLHQVSCACKLGSTQILIRQNFDYLFGTMLSHTRLPGDNPRDSQAGFPMSIPSIAQIALRISVNESRADDKSKRGICIPSKRSLSDETCVSYAIELVTALVARFDRSLATSNHNTQLSTSFELVQLLDSAVSFVASSFDLDIDQGKENVLSIGTPVAREPWLTLLDSFRSFDFDSEVSSGKEGFEKFLKEKDDRACADEIQPSIEITQAELDFLNLVLARCSFFLSSPSLHVQVASCNCMRHSFMLLGHVATYTKVSEQHSVRVLLPWPCSVLVSHSFVVRLRRTITMVLVQLSFDRSAGRGQQSLLDFVQCHLR